MTKEKDVANVGNRVFVDADVISLVINAFAFCFKDARLSTTCSSDIEHKKYVGQVSTTMRAFRSKVGDSLSHFHKSDETQAEINKTF